MISMILFLQYVHKHVVNEQLFVTHYYFKASIEKTLPFLNKQKLVIL